ncbi:MAG: hypothetical protein Q9179_002849 [Wetmoreana sp. 5 TL-2023]
MTSAHQENTWPDYATFVKELAKVDSNFKRLADFFSENLPREDLEGDLKILESHDDVIEDQTRSIDDLRIPPKAGTTRIVVLSYEMEWCLDRVMLDKVAFALNLPPFFLLQHLDESGLKDSQKSRPLVAASEVQSIELSWGFLTQLSTMIASPATPLTGPVLIVLVRGSFGLDLSCSTQILGPTNTLKYALPTLAGLNSYETFKRSLTCMSPDAIEAANSCSPCDFLCPFVAGVRRSNAKRAAVEMNRDQQLEVTTQKIEDWCSLAKENATNLSQYLRNHPTTSTPAMSTVLQDLESVRSTIEGYQGQAQILLNRSVSQLSLEESRKSIQQSSDTKRLTQLAYIFLPLSLSTSAFGMNTVELQNTRLWMFFVTSVVLVVLSLVLWPVFGWLSDTFSKNPIIILKIFGVLFKLFWLSPSHATTLLFFTLCHSMLESLQTLEYLNLWRRYYPDTDRPAIWEEFPSTVRYVKPGWQSYWAGKIVKVDSFLISTPIDRKYFWQKPAS